VTWEHRVASEPWKHDLLSTLRRVEALNPDKPRLGDSAILREEYLDLGQEPHMSFASANIAKYVPATKDHRARLLVRFFGMLGPMGPLPLTTTDEARRWYRRDDDAFARFLDIFNSRFLQFFYRAFADARPAEQAARPDQDRFADYVGSVIGIGAKPWRNLDSMPDLEKLRFAGLLGSRVISASRIEHLVSGTFGVRAEVEQFIGMALELGPDEVSRLGQANARLGKGLMLGSRVLSVDHKFRLRIEVETLEVYEAFLPGGRWCKRLADTIANVVGHEYDWDVELLLREELAPPVKLGGYGRLGWTGWMRKPERPTGRRHVRARFSPNALTGTQ